VSHTKNMVEKLMISYYLSNYAESNPDLALLSVSTFVRNMKNEDPKYEVQH